MNLIYYRGLNCYLSSILSIAEALGVNHTNAYSGLWPETDFTYDEKYQLYTSKSILSGFKSAGITVTAQEVNGAAEAEQAFSQIPDGVLFFIGTDFYYIPWHPVYGHFNGPHYFFARKNSARAVTCYDPVYHESGVTINPSGILSGAYEIGRVYKAESGADYASALLREAEAFLRVRPALQTKLISAIESCKAAGRPEINRLAKYVTALTNNRHLYARFYHGGTPPRGTENFFTNPHLLKWEAIKNGLYKSTIQISKKAEILNEVSTLTEKLLNEEREMAESIIFAVKTAALSLSL